MKIGERIKECRIFAGLTQKELSEKVGVSDKTISAYENNHKEPKLEVLQKLAKELNISSDYLLGITDKYISYNQDNILELPRSVSDEFIASVRAHIELLKKART